MYAGALSGLITAEREYDTHEQLLASTAPPFDGVEVTDRIEFTGGELAGKSFESLRPMVEMLLRRV